MTGWVLVTDHVDGRSRTAVATVRALAQAGYRPVVAVSGGRSAAASSRACAGVAMLPRPGELGYPAAVEREVAARRHLAVLPASDAALVALERPGAALVDKSVLPARAAAAGLPMPPTQAFDTPAELTAAAEDLDYPLVVKETLKVGAPFAARRIESPRALTTLATQLSGRVVVQPFQRGGMQAVCGVIHDGTLLATVHQSYLRTWPVDCGVASSAVTSPPDLDLEDRLPELLDGHSGVFQVQFVDGLLIDVNPRVYGSVPLAVMAGANLPALACAAEQGRIGGMVRGREGVRYRWLEGDLRSLLHGLRSRELTLPAAVRALRPRVGTAHSVESLRDPGPVVSRLADVATRRLR